MTIHKAKWLLVGLVCLVLWSAYAPAQSSEWGSYRRAGFKAYVQGNYAEAEKQLAAALGLAERFGPAHLPRARHAARQAPRQSGEEAW